MGSHKIRKKPIGVRKVKKGLITKQNMQNLQKTLILICLKLCTIVKHLSPKTPSWEAGVFSGEEFYPNNPLHTETESEKNVRRLHKKFSLLDEWPEEVIGSSTRNGKIYVDIRTGSKSKIAKFISRNLGSAFEEFNCSLSRDVEYVEQENDFELCAATGSRIAYTNDTGVARRLTKNLRLRENEDRRGTGKVGFIAHATKDDDPKTVLVTCKHNFLNDEQTQDKHTDDVNGYYFSQEYHDEMGERHLVSRRCTGLYGTQECTDDEGDTVRQAIDLGLVEVDEKYGSAAENIPAPLHIYGDQLCDIKGKDVYKSDKMNTYETKGRIVDSDYYRKIAGNRTAAGFFLVKPSCARLSQFGQVGDSGSLVYFIDDRREKQAIGLFHSINRKYKMRPTAPQEEVAVCISLESCRKLLRQNKQTDLVPADNWDSSRLKTCGTPP